MRLTLRIDFDDQRRLGPGKAQILELIGAHGSITAAGRVLNMSYKRAWKLVCELNTMFREPLVTAHTGGKGGGHAALTPMGQEVLRLYRAEIHAGSDQATLNRLNSLLSASKH
jgi:molybdate transport system regulatory protein